MADRMLYPIAEVAAELSVHKATVYRLVAAGELVTVKIGRRTLIPHASLANYVARLTGSANVTSIAS